MSLAATATCSTDCNTEVDPTSGATDDDSDTDKNGLPSLQAPEEEPTHQRTASISAAFGTIGFLIAILAVLIAVGRRRTRKVKNAENAEASTDASGQPSSTIHRNNLPRHSTISVDVFYTATKEHTIRDASNDPVALEREREEMRSAWNHRWEERAAAASSRWGRNDGTSKNDNRRSTRHGSRSRRSQFWRRHHSIHMDRRNSSSPVQPSPLSQAAFPTDSTAVPVISNIASKIDSDKCPRVLSAPNLSTRQQPISMPPVPPPDHLPSAHTSMELPRTSVSSSDHSYSTTSTTSFVYRVLSGYEPNLQDEMMVKTGDLVIVHDIWEDGWCRGTLVDERGELLGDAGVFPLVCLRKWESEISDGGKRITRRRLEDIVGRGAKQEVDGGMTWDAESATSDMTIYKSSERTYSLTPLDFEGQEKKLGMVKAQSTET
ncbi:hypothetical protein HDV00_008767 [Rhizophlyctis rosea]|nr:hypothetical protein HDV00_008767 [Rhizophlyctis rosea]